MKNIMKNENVIKRFHNFLNEDKNYETHDELVNFFEDEGFLVHLFEQDNQQCAELEKWTDGGVDMNIVLMPFTAEKFKEYVKDFDIDEEIDLHRQGEDYKKVFTIRQSLEDFTNFLNELEATAEKL